MDKKPKFILIGTGGFGVYWCKQIVPYITQTLGIASIVAAVDINPDALKNAVDFTGLPKEKCYTDARRAFEENEADFVALVVPPAYREKMVSLALEYNCHIISEKPLSATMESSCRIHNMLKNSGKKMAITMSHTFDQDKQTLKSILQSGRYGRLNYIAGKLGIDYSRKILPYVSGSIYDGIDPLLLDCAIHHLDILKMLSGSNAKTVYAKSFNPAWSITKGDITGFAALEMENGVRAFYEGNLSSASESNPWGNESFRAECEFATVELDHRVITAKSNLGLPQEEYTRFKLLDQESWSHTWILKMFIEWINGGKEPECSIDNNMQSTALLFSTIESAHTGKEIDIQMYLKSFITKSGS